MSDPYFVTTTEDPSLTNARSKSCHPVVSRAPWEHGYLWFGISVRGRRSWGAPLPDWKREVVYYNTSAYPLARLLTTIVTHHTNGAGSVAHDESHHRSRGFAALGYHFFIDVHGIVFEGRPLEVMGSHAGVAIKKGSGPMTDPDWGAVGIVLQGDFHHADDWLINEEPTSKQLRSLEALLNGLRRSFPGLTKLLLHREVPRTGRPTVCPGDHLAPRIIALRRKLGFRGP